MRASQATASLYSEFHGELFGFLKARGLSTEASEDVLQAAFLRLQTSLNQGTELEQPRSWLYQVVRRLMVDAYRTRAREERMAHLLLEQSEPDEAAPLDEPELYQAVARLLPRFVDSLDEPYREALTLTELQELTHSEAAKQAGVSLTCMKSRVRRGRTLVFSALKSCCRFETDGRGRMNSCEPQAGGSCDACG